MNVGKCIIQPLYFRERNEREQKEYDEQMKNISALYEDEAEFLLKRCLVNACRNRQMRLFFRK